MADNRCAVKRAVSCYYNQQAKNQQALTQEVTGSITGKIWASRFTPGAALSRNISTRLPLPCLPIIPMGTPATICCGDPVNRIWVVKNTAIGERGNLEPRMDAFSTFNHPTFGNPSADITNKGTVGRISRAGGNRTIRIGAKLTF